MRTSQLNIEILPCHFNLFDVYISVSSGYQWFTLNSSRPSKGSIMKEYIVLIAYLATAIIAGNGFWHNPMDVDAGSILQARKIDKYLISSPEPTRYPKLDRKLLMVRGLPGQKPLSVNAQMAIPSPKTPRRTGMGGTSQKLLAGSDNTRSGLRSNPQRPQHSAKMTRLRGVDTEHPISKSSVAPLLPDQSKPNQDYTKPKQPSKAVQKTKYKAQACITAKGPACLSVSGFGSIKERQKQIEYEQSQTVSANIATTMRTEHRFGAMASGVTRDPSPSYGRRKSAEAIKAKARGSTVFTKVTAPTGGRGHIVFKESGKTEVVDVPSGETVEQYRSTSNGPIRATAKVSRGGEVRIGGIYEDDIVKY